MLFMLNCTCTLCFPLLFTFELVLLVIDYCELFICLLLDKEDFLFEGVKLQLFIVIERDLSLKFVPLCLRMGRE